MTDRKSLSLSEAWRDGKSLEEALSLFDPQLDKAALIADRRSHRALVESGKERLRAAGADADHIYDGLSLLGPLQTRVSAASQSRESRIRQLIAALESGNLRAIGYAAHHGAKADLELVPQFLIQRKFVNFKLSEFGDGEWRFAKVRVVSDIPPNPVRMGRPSVRDAIYEIADDIIDEIIELVPKEQAYRIQSYGKSRYPEKFNDNSPTIDTIKRHLRYYWKSKKGA